MSDGIPRGFEICRTQKTQVMSGMGSMECSELLQIHPSKSGVRVQFSRVALKPPDALSELIDLDGIVQIRWRDKHPSGFYA